MPESDAPAVDTGRYREFAPRALTQAMMHAGQPPLVDRVWAKDATPLANDAHNVLPDGAVDLLATVHPDGSVQSLFAVGAMTHPVCVPPSTTGFLGIRLLPGAAKTVFGVPQSELTDRNVDIFELFERQRARAVTGAMQQLVLGVCATDALDEAALARLMQALGAHRRAMPGVVSTAVADLAATSGRRRVAKLASSLGVTRQHLARVFAEHVGLSPKLFAEISRVRAMLSAFARSRRGWSDVAYDFGYVDQSHLIAEVRRITGRTPSEWRHEAGSISPIPVSAQR